MNQSRFKSFRGGVAGGLVATLLVGMAATPGRAQIPVTDFAHIMQSILNVLNQLEQWYQQIQKMRETYALAYAAYTGLKNWQGLGWIEALQLAELPWFDGVDGIEELRELAAAGTLSLQQLQAIFRESDQIKRMMNDPLYARSQAYAAKVNLWAAHYSRVVKMRIAMSRTMKSHQDELEKLKSQAQLVTAQIQALSGQDPAPIPAIQALQGKLQAILVKIEANQGSMREMKDTLQKKEEHDLETVRGQALISDEQYNQAQRDLKGFFSFVGM